MLISVDKYQKKNREMINFLNKINKYSRSWEINKND